MKLLALAPLLLGTSWLAARTIAGDDAITPALRPFAPLVGTTWVGTFPGGDLRDTQEFEWMFGGKYLRNRHAVSSGDGKVVYEGETVYGWDAERKTLVWWYFNSTGGHVTGEAVLEGSILVAEGRNHGGGGQVDRVRSELVLEEGGWRSISFFPEGDGWKERFDMEFRPAP